MRTLTEACVSAVLAVATAVPCFGADLWSPGTTSASWERISRLQSVSRTATVRSPFVIDCCRSEDPLERMAAICWIARTRSVPHIADLQARLADRVPQIRQLALEALVIMPHPEAAESVLKAITTFSDLTDSSLRFMGYRRPSNGQSDRERLLQKLAEHSLDWRQDWAAHLLDKKEWIDQSAQEYGDSMLFRARLNSSVLKSGRSFYILFEAVGEPQRRPVPHRHMYLTQIQDPGRVQDLARARERPGEFRYLTLGYRTKIANGTCQCDLMDDRTSPGIYALDVASIDGDRFTAERFSGERFPFFVRVNRSSEDEREIPQLLERLPDPLAVTRLGELRAHAAVPQLIELFHATPPGCEQSGIGRALAAIGDGRAADLFLDHPTLSCLDSGWSAVPWLGELDSAAEPVYAKRIEAATELLDSWDRMDISKRASSLQSIAWSLAYCRRPLSRDQVQNIEKLLTHISDLLAKQDEPDNDLQRRMATLLLMYSLDDRDTLLAWLTKFQESPRFYLTTIEELDRRSNFSDSGMLLPSETRQAMHDQLQTWRDKTPLTPELESQSSSVLQRLRTNRPVERNAARPADKVKQLFGRRYFFDDCQQFWCEADDKPERWGAFCRPIQDWFVLDAETLCVQTKDGSLQVVRRDEPVRSWSSASLWGAFRGDSKDQVSRNLEVTRVGDSLVVNTYACLVLVLPLVGNSGPWFVDEPTAWEPVPEEPDDPANPFGPRRAPPRPQTLNDRVRPTKADIWKLDNKILIIVNPYGTKTYPAQCVDIAKQKIIWERRVASADLQKVITAQGWKELNE